MRKIFIDSMGAIETKCPTEKISRSEILFG